MMENNMDSSYYSLERREMLQFVPPWSKKILDAGCGSGNFGAILKREFGAEVTGIELCESACLQASKKLDRAICGSLEDKISSLPDHYFDCMIFNDILEHLTDPWAVLKTSRIKLSSGGAVVASIPNIRHLYTLFDIIVKKDFKYSDAGVLDRSHLRFFTKKSAGRMFEESGYTVTKIQGINGMKSWKFKILNAAFLGTLTESSFLQFAVIASPEKSA